MMNRKQINGAIGTNKRVRRIRELVEQIRGNFDGYDAEVTIDSPSRDLQDWFALMNEALTRADDDSAMLREDAEVEVEVANLNEEHSIDDDDMSLNETIMKILESADA